MNLQWKYVGNDLLSLVVAFKINLFKNFVCKFVILGEWIRLTNIFLPPNGCELAKSWWMENKKQKKRTVSN